MTRPTRHSSFSVISLAISQPVSYTHLIQNYEKKSRETKKAAAAKIFLQKTSSYRKMCIRDRLISLFQRFCFHIIFYFEHVKFLSHIVSLFIVFQIRFSRACLKKAFCNLYLQWTAIVLLLSLIHISFPQNYRQSTKVLQLKFQGTGNCKPLLWSMPERLPQLAVSMTRK